MLPSLKKGDRAVCHGNVRSGHKSYIDRFLAALPEAKFMSKTGSRTSTSNYLEASNDA
jgi:hypothetical protein